MLLLVFEFVNLYLFAKELLGSSETSGPQTASYPGAMRLGMVGKCYPSWEIKIDKPDEHGIGEICTRKLNSLLFYCVFCIDSLLLLGFLSLRLVLLEVFFVY